MTHNPYAPPASRVSDALDANALPAHEPGSLGFFFSARGRLNRKQYWANGILSLLLLPVLFAIVGAIVDMAWLVPLSEMAVAWSSTVMVARRAHDFDFSAWWASAYAACLLLAVLIPRRYGVAALLAYSSLFLILLVVGLIPGETSANRFGLPQGDGPQIQEAV